MKNIPFRAFAAVALALTLVVGGFALAATPRVRAIPHESAENFSNTVIFNSPTKGTVTVERPGAATGAAAQPVLTMHQISDAGVAEMAVETRVITMSSNTATYTFNKPFAHAPVCTCGDTTITTPVACSANAATSTQVVVFSIGASAVVNVICVGAR